MLNKKIDFKTSIGLGLSLAMVSTLNLTSAFANVINNVPDDDFTDGSVVSEDYSEDYEWYEEEEEEEEDVCEMAAIRYLRSLGYDIYSMTTSKIELCKWRIVTKQGELSREEIESMVEKYGSEVICLTLDSLEYNAEEADFDLFKYMLDNHCIKGVEIARIYEEVKDLRNSGKRLEDIDVVELSFKKYQDNLRSKECGLFKISKSDIEKYIEKLGDLDISEEAKAAKERCLALIEAAENAEHR